MSTTPRRRIVIDAPPVRVRRDVLGKWGKPKQEEPRADRAPRGKPQPEQEPGPPVVYVCAAEMPGAKVLPHVRWELFSQGLARGLSQRQAYKNAGFPPSTEAAADSEAYHLAKNRQIKDRVAYHMRLIAEVAGITPELIAREMHAVATAHMRDAVAWNGGKVDLKDSEKLDERTSAAVSEVSQGKEGVKIKFHSKMDALTKLGQMHAMFVERKEISGPGGGPIRHIDDGMTSSEAAEAYSDMVKGDGS